LLARGEPHLRAVAWWLRPVEWAKSVVGLSAADAVETQTIRPDGPSDEAPVTPLSVMVELVDNDDLARRLKRSSRRRR
jgi:hypothetical protein